MSHWTKTPQVRIHPTYYGNSLHSDWSFNTSKNYNESNIYKWSKPIRVSNVTWQGAGENGTKFVASADLTELMDQLIEQENYNLLASNMISLHRSLPDSRSDECKRLSYPEKLPNTSIVIIFHNEAWTPLLRTAWSVVERSPPELINEIILVDDASTMSDLKRPLDDYIEQIPGRIKLIRLSKREGLIRARLVGAKHASGSVLTFLDGHIECNEGWLQPLLARIANDRSVIAVPYMDAISSHDMSYRSGKNAKIHGFRWSLIFDWMPVPERERIRTKYDYTASIRTPTMVGCAFSIDREFFFEIGSYDEGMDIWGSENMEMSLRVWQCGGSMEMIPCSHVGHLFRISTYSFDGDPLLIKGRNNVRLVEVWMEDDAKRMFYATNNYCQNVSAGDITQRIELKKQLKCKDFRWYLENVYPESMLRKKFVDFVQIRNVKVNKCLDIYPGTEHTSLKLYSCHGHRKNQLLFLTNDQMIVTRRQFCVGVDEKQHTVQQMLCNYDDSNWWRYENGTKWIVHVPSGQCMQAAHARVVLGKCDTSDETVKWNIESTP
ncbi:polypeptide N-acetylgalactosaminyltransferase 5-like [Bradysia coprophila]|uniref:polypeptide N-acetylgalactosaminyltransferase 5-like n=1 Tax=Bradysia coprophila TaxID=38358 RepID=UPI00187DB05D|nr:polypeptide N-acetylgalactosaminyltransferase 5-like [Bradysia coprophila]